jgi:hypothetical protein
MATPVPPLSEYQKMQLLIAQAANEANTPSPRPRRLRKASPSPGHSRQHSTMSAFNNQPKLETNNCPPIKASSSSTRSYFSEDGICTPTSAKVAVYDEWQELLRNAQKEGEAGASRSRRAISQRPPKQTNSPAPRKRPKRETSNDINSTEGNEMCVEEINKADSEIASMVVAISKVNQYEEMQELVKKAEKEAKGDQSKVVGVKTRRNVQSLGGEEISKVKSEVSAVQVQFFNELPQTLEERNVKSKERSLFEEGPIFKRRRSSTKMAEAGALEENRLFWFAILATEGNY